MDRARGSITTALAWLLLTSSTAAQSAPDAGVPFRPRPVSQARYAIQPPTADPARQRHLVTASDGVRIWTETWLPKVRDGQVPPARVPTVLNYSPYLTGGFPGGQDTRIMEAVVSHGYAYTTAHARGSGASEGCPDLLGRQEADDASRVVEYLGRDAPWTTGSVGMYGLSYNGATQVLVAGLGDPARTHYLKAIVPLAPVTSAYDFVFQDGVPFVLVANEWTLGYFVEGLILYDEVRDPRLYAARLPCQPALALDHQSLDGSFTAAYEERELRRGAARIRAATLLSHGLADTRVRPISSTGLFDRLPRSTPKAGVFGVYGHEPPDNHYFATPAVHPEWERADWKDMVLAWYDRYLLGLDSGVEDWPVAQVQGSDGQWRAARRWPQSGEPRRLALGAGDLEPRGASTYVEGGPETVGADYPPGTAAVFETAPVRERTVVGGQPELDAWVVLDRPDAHLAAKLEVLDAAGTKVPFARATGLRSLRHLDAPRDGHFAQRSGVAPPVGSPVHVTVRFDPAELVVPEGGRLRLTLAGSVIVFDGLEGVHPGAGAILYGPSQPSGLGTRLTVLHDRAHPGELRFRAPGRHPKLLDVREKDEGYG